MLSKGNTFHLFYFVSHICFFLSFSSVFSLAHIMIFDVACSSTIFSLRSSHLFCREAEEEEEKE